MKKTALIALVLFSSEGMAALTSKEKALWTTAGGCAIGGGVGGYLDSKDDDPRKSSQGTIAGSAVVGCLTGALFSWVFMDDDQGALARDNDNLRTKLGEYEGLLRDRSGNIGGRSFDDTITSKPVGKKDLPSELSQLINQGCEAREFSLGFDGGTGKAKFIPVNGQVAIQSFKYYLVVPKDGSDRDCVKPHSAYGYLEKEITNLGEILINKGVNKNGRSK